MSTFPTEFTPPIFSYDIHVYFDHTNQSEIELAEQLHDLVNKTFINPANIDNKLPTARIFKLHKQPIGPHPVGMFEIDFKTPAEFAILVPWFQIHHGTLSVLVHPRTGNAYQEHTEYAIWIGEKVPLIVKFLMEH
jgi:aromatic ring-cleaving dioxygenase